jgi:CRP-like cAMP-binding protein
MAVHGVFDVGGDRPGEDGKMGETLRTLGTIERVLFLHRVPLFANLTPEDLQAIAEVAGERLFLEGDALCTEGEESDDLFIIVEGRVRVTKQANGASRTLGVREVGEPIGEMGILRRQPRSATVTAEGGSVRTLVMTGRAFESILRERPQVALATLACLAERLSGLV